MAYNPLCAMCCSHVGIKGGQSQFLEVSSSRVMLNSTEDFVSQRGKLTLGSAFANSRINYLFFVFLPVPSYSFFFFLNSWQNTVFGMSDCITSSPQI